MEDGNAMPIAIVGMGCRFPGDATQPEKLWDLIMRKKSARTEMPSDRFNIDGFYHPEAGRYGSMSLRGAHFIQQDISEFDAPFFSISPAEAISMDPMQRMLLEVVYESIENAGIPISKLAGSNTGCYVGCFTHDYDELAKHDGETIPKYDITGNGQSILSNRVSFCFDLKGPSMTLDTACSSSLVALHLACQSLKAGESDSVIVGCSNAILSPNNFISMTNLGLLGKDGVSYAFDERANGYARGEGIASVVLKPLASALRDGDTIRGVIRGTAVNSNGRGQGLTMPSKEAQIRLMKTAYGQAGLDFAKTAYVEAHGTGTQAGDPIEAGAIDAVLGPAQRPNNNKVIVGSVKTNIGHLEGASGLAGLIKAVMTIEKGVIAPNIFFEKGNPKMDWDKMQITIPTEATPWPVEGLRRVSVNGFGYGGTNGHVVIDDAFNYLKERGLRGHHRTLGFESDNDDDQNKEKEKKKKKKPETTVTGDEVGTGFRSRVFPISGRDATSAKDFHKTLAEYVRSQKLETEAEEQTFLDDLSFTLAEHRSRFEHRSVVVAASKDDLLEKLEGTITLGRAKEGSSRLAFLFTGQGAQWWGMGRELVGHPTFRRSLERCREVVASLGSPWDLVEELLKDEKSSRINEATISQPMCTAVQLCMVDLLATLDIVPSKVAGHSSGEIGAAYAAGILTFDTAVKVAYFRGLLAPNIKKKGFRGGMLAAGLSETEALDEVKAVDEEHGKAVVACVNSPKSVTLSGDMTALTQLQMSLTAKGKFARRLLVDTAYHSHHMQAIAQDYKDALGPMTRAAVTDVVMVSSVTGEIVKPEDNLDADYWAANMVSCVRFSDALAKLCLDYETEGEQTLQLVEIGPHSALAGPIKQTTSALPSDLAGSIKYHSALLRGKDAFLSFMGLVAGLMEAGRPVNWRKVLSRANALADLPPYSWNHSKKYWAESRIHRDYRNRPFPRTEILGAPSYDWNPLEPRFRGFVRLHEMPWVAGHVVNGAILYPAAGFCSMALQAAKQLTALEAGPNAPVPEIAEYRVRDFVISRALVVPRDNDGVEVTLHMRARPTGSLASSDTWREFRIFSYNEGSSSWTEHSRGLVSVAKEAGTVSLDSTGVSRIAASSSWPTVDCTDMYEGLAKAGLYYGPEFQSITDIAVGEGAEVVGTIQVTDTKSTMPKAFEGDRVIHPTTLDAFLQLCISSLCRGDTANLDQAYVPTFIKDITIAGDLDSQKGSKFVALADAKKHGLRDILGNIHCIDASTQQPAIRLTGIKCRGMASGQASFDAAAKAYYDHCGRVVWRPDVDLLSEKQLGDAILAAAADADAEDTLSHVAEYVDLLSFKNPNLDFLELGAASGGLAAPVIAALSRSSAHAYLRVKSFTYTDASDETFEAAAAELSGDYDAYLKFKKLDIAEDPETQGFTTPVDVVLAAAAAAASVVDLANARKIVKAGGKLILTGASAETKDALSAAGFVKIFESAQAVIAKAAVEEAVPAAATSGDKTTTTTTTILLVSDSEESSEYETAVVGTLKEKLGGVEVVKFSELAGRDTESTAIVSLVELTTPLLEDISQPDFERLQHLTHHNGGLFWVTRGAWTSRPELSLFHGLARTVRVENERSLCVSFDLADDGALPAEAAAELVASVYSGRVAGSIEDNEIVERDGRVEVKRVIQDDARNEFVGQRVRDQQPKARPEPISAHREARRVLELQIGAVGDLGSLSFKDQGSSFLGTPLAEGEVEIEVVAVGLNARDVQVTQGELAEDFLGAECSGIVKAVGSGVTSVSRGDRVAAWTAGSLATSVRASAATVGKIPESLSFAEAAALPFAFATAFQGLVNVADLAEGESVLIHAGASPIGQAAIQIAQSVGADVFVTVDSDDKRAQLASAYRLEASRLLDSRDLAFVKPVKAATAGRGVDVVLNALSGEALHASWTETLAPFGRFLELGKRDIDGNARLDMAPYARNAVFAAVDVSNLLASRPKQAGKLFRQVMEGVAAGQYKPAQPLVKEPFGRVQESFRAIQSDKHMGKTVLELAEADSAMVLPRPVASVSLPADASYLLVGGLGGIGRSISRWMVDHGARNLIFVSRSGASSPAAAQLVTDLEKQGARVEILKCDATDAAKLSSAVGAALQSLPPLRGIVQAAMVLQDGLFESMSYERWTTSLRPKVQGTWALHNVAKELSAPLDFFVMLSSSAAFIGNAGQSNYVSGNTFQTALARFRRQQGLPAVALDFGKVAEIGVVAENAGGASDSNLDRLGLPGITEAEVLSLVEMAIIADAHLELDAKPATLEDGENSHIVTGVIDLIKPESGERDMPFWGRDPVFNHMDYVRPQPQSGDGTDDASKANTVNLRDVVSSKDSIDDEKMQLDVLSALTTKLAKALMLVAADVDHGKSPSDLGADSLVGVELRNFLAREASVDLPVFDILGSSSLKTISKNVSKLIRAGK